MGMEAVREAARKATVPALGLPLVGVVCAVPSRVAP